ncbi:Putative RNA polymerase II subunit B1 CTD phosphatase RPAP2 [Melipona quadrifasciata]|uniref:RNA polymerase II subunit B1 CTD phosphatase RPAP2 homolog n=1 Tax=Melipona quadrifasciata TaxID=166423 RepID=A0A0M8ZUZ8_9HYME|nr:Putative RNA polymerase II subunit B1 CTD phosphatase RPAP2 [Melipona quadrifasciata]
METFIKTETFERKKVKKKMSKAQIQLAVIKKKECDAKALTIVEQLLEPKIDSQWLLSNLKYINKSHMEDVIEERAIIKLCGYVLCNNALATIIDQRYHISTKKNKVYDITRRKNFCSSHCYGASNYLLKQMFTSPLWLRDKEEIPEFRILSNKNELKENILGDEIYVNEHIKDNKICNKLESILLSKSSETITHDEYIAKISQTDHENICTNNIIEKFDILKEFSKNNDEESVNVKKLSSNLENKDNILQNCIVTQSTTNANNDIVPFKEDKYQNTENEEQNELLETSEIKYNTTIIKHDIITNNKDSVQKVKQKKKRYEQINFVKENQSNKFYNLAIHIEHNVRNWITEDTISLLLGEKHIKNQLLENIAQHDKYLNLCKKLNKLQLEDEKYDRLDLTTNTLKPLPHLSILREEGEKVELKVRAFYKGSMIIENHKNITEVAHQNNDFSPILPLTDAHAPKILRRRIFLDIINRILPDLLCALAGNKLPQYTYNNAKSTLIKALVNTFSLSAANVIFKTAEWTLVGLIIIKMLSMIDPELKFVLSTKQATMYISMILMSYKLDSNYLDKLIMELINMDISDIDNTININVA